VTSDLRREADDNRAPPGYYTANSGNSLLTFRENLSVPSSRVKNRSKMGPISGPKSTVRNCHYPLCNRPEERSSQYNFCSEGTLCVQIRYCV